MKKLSILCAMALALGFTACDDQLPNPQPVPNPELPTFNSSDLVIEQGNLGDAVINLQTYADKGEKVRLAKVEKLVNFPYTYSLVFDVEVSADPYFEKSGMFTATVDSTTYEDGTYIVAIASNVNTAIYENLTKNPAQLKVYTRFAAYGETATGRMRLGGADYFYGEYTYDFVPFEPEQVLTDTYFLYTRAAGQQSWTQTQFVKGNANLSVYDDGVFGAVVETATDNVEWKVVPEGGADLFIAGDDVYANAGALAAEGKCGVLATAGKYLVGIDVLGMTYSVAPAYGQLYVPIGVSSSGAKQADLDKALALSTTNSVVFTGTIRLNQNWYFIGERSVEAGVYLLNGEVTGDAGTETANIAFATNFADRPTGEDGNPLYGPMKNTSGLYYVEANVASLNYSATRVTTLNLVGDFNNWTISDDYALTPKNNASGVTTWSATDVELKAGDYVICANGLLTFRYGGSDADVVRVNPDGGNLKVAADGKYDVTLNFGVQPNTITLTKK